MKIDANIECIQYERCSWKNSVVRYSIGSWDVVLAQHHRTSEYVETSEYVQRRLIIRVCSVWEQFNDMVC